ncbi:MAG: hypothetical protein RIT43_649 [Bacteroidota bacterium]|jgi:hypothetical protein
MYKPFIKYIAVNKVFAIVVAYFLFSSILKATSEIDICIPCLWKTMFGFECPGCGLTTAFISLLELNFKKAFENNWLIFVVVPFGLCYLTFDYLKFKKNSPKRSR